MSYPETWIPSPPPVRGYVDYRGLCPDCFKPVLRLVQPHTGSVCDIDPRVQKRGEGYVRVELYQGHCYFIPTKLAKRQEGLHLPHLCQTEEEKTEQWLKASQEAAGARRRRRSTSRTPSTGGRHRASVPTADRR